MELNGFFGAVLRGLGFEVHARGGRVSLRIAGTSEEERAGGGFTGWGHMVNLVTAEGRVWLVDVGFGADGPVSGVPVDFEGREGDVGEEVQRIGEQVIRVRRFGSGVGEREGLGGGGGDMDQRDEVRVLELRTKGQQEWSPVYAFTRYVAFGKRDYEVMNWHVSTFPKSFFTQKLLGMRFIRDEESGKVVGGVILFEDHFERKIGSEKEELSTCKTEAERVNGLKKWFGIDLDEAEIAGIKGLPTALGD
jgi:arylamine N-acetyltransferase